MIENFDKDIGFVSDKRIAYSQAISLKRIADALEKLTKVPTEQDKMMKEIVNNLDYTK